MGRKSSGKRERAIAEQLERRRREEEATERQREDNWSPWARSPVAVHEGREQPLPPYCLGLYFNSHYTVYVFDYARGGLEGRASMAVHDLEVPNGVLHLSIRRTDRRPIHNWRHLQRIKNDLVGPECEGVELYPAEGRKHDTANQFHLWVCRAPGESLLRAQVGWQSRSVAEGAGSGKARQEDLHPEDARHGVVVTVAALDEDIQARERARDRLLGYSAGGLR